MKKFSDLKKGDVVILHTDDTRYKDEEKTIKSIGPKWIKLDKDYQSVKYSIIDGKANDYMPGYYLMIPNQPEVIDDVDDDFFKTRAGRVNYLLNLVLPKYLDTLDDGKLKYLQRRWTKKILDKDENNSTV